MKHGKGIRSCFKDVHSTVCFGGLLCKHFIMVCFHQHELLLMWPHIVLLWERVPMKGMLCLKKLLRTIIIGGMKEDHKRELLWFKNHQVKFQVELLV